MKSHPSFLKALIIPVASGLIVLGFVAGALGQTPGPKASVETQRNAERNGNAVALPAESEAEHLVLEKLKLGLEAGLKNFPEGQRQLPADFLKALFTNKDPNLKFPRGIVISHAVITGALELTGVEIPHEIYLRECTFTAPVRFSHSHFTKNFKALGCRFKDADFSGVKAGAFVADDCQFESESVDFRQMRVEGVFSLTRTKFIGAQTDSVRTVIFDDLRAGDFYLNQSSFNNFFLISFERLRAESVAFDEVDVQTGAHIDSRQMSFKRFSPAQFDDFRWLLSAYDDKSYAQAEKSFGAEFYTSVETVLRSQGYQAEADEVFVERRRAERRHKCPNFVTKCESRPRFFVSALQDGFTGYGKRLQNLLYWGVLFVLIGTIVFRREDGMKPKDAKDAQSLAGKYRPFWYSLDLFLPFISLGDAKAWTPRDDRRWANGYKKAHMIIGSLFVPIGIAAWSGLFK